MTMHWIGDLMTDRRTPAEKRRDRAILVIGLAVGGIAFITFWGLAIYGFCQLVGMLFG